ncbi:MAG: hypothetical protein M1483_00655 [Actinobacteria bacterium]|nr:hypothetical protein [Actinomycetota bacterium]MCL6104144.1 hypothetical protein [Actinomycetota bacterium]
MYKKFGVHKQIRQVGKRLFEPRYKLYYGVRKDPSVTSEIGQAMIIVLGVLLLLALLPAILAASASSQTQSVISNGNVQSATSAAYVGVSDYMYHVERDPSYTAYNLNNNDFPPNNLAYNGSNANTPCHYVYQGGSTAAANTLSWAVVPGKTGEYFSYCVYVVPATSASPTYYYLVSTGLSYPAGTYKVTGGMGGFSSSSWPKAEVVTVKLKLNQTSFLKYAYFTSYNVADPNNPSDPYSCLWNFPQGTFSVSSAVQCLGWYGGRSTVETLATQRCLYNAYQPNVGTWTPASGVNTYTPYPGIGPDWYTMVTNLSFPGFSLSTSFAPGGCNFTFFTNGPTESRHTIDTQNIHGPFGTNDAIYPCGESGSQGAAKNLLPPTFPNSQVYSGIPNPSPLTSIGAANPVPLGYWYNSPAFGQTIPNFAAYDSHLGQCNNPTTATPLTFAGNPASYQHSVIPQQGLPMKANIHSLQVAATSSNGCQYYGPTLIQTNTNGTIDAQSPGTQSYPGQPPPCPTGNSINPYSSPFNGSGVVYVGNLQSLPPSNVTDVSCRANTTVTNGNTNTLTNYGCVAVGWSYIPGQYLNSGSPTEAVVYVTTNGGQTWTQDTNIPSNLSGGQAKLTGVSCIDTSSCWAIGQDNATPTPNPVIIYTSNAGSGAFASWSAQSVPPALTLSGSSDPVATLSSIRCIGNDPDHDGDSYVSEADVTNGSSDDVPNQAACWAGGKLAYSANFSSNNTNIQAALIENTNALSSATWSNQSPLLPSGTQSLSGVAIQYAHWNYNNPDPDNDGDNDTNVATDTDAFCSDADNDGDCGDADKDGDGGTSGWDYPDGWNYWPYNNPGDNNNYGSNAPDSDGKDPDADGDNDTTSNTALNPDYNDPDNDGDNDTSASTDTDKSCIDNGDHDGDGCSSNPDANDSDSDGDNDTSLSSDSDKLCSGNDTDSDGDCGDTDKDGDSSNSGWDWPDGYNYWPYYNPGDNGPATETDGTDPDSDGDNDTTTANPPNTDYNADPDSDGDNDTTTANPPNGDINDKDHDGDSVSNDTDYDSDSDGDSYNNDNDGTWQCMDADYGSWSTSCNDTDSSNPNMDTEWTEDLSAGDSDDHCTSWTWWGSCDGNSENSDESEGWNWQWFGDDNAPSSSNNDDSGDATATNETITSGCDEGCQIDAPADNDSGAYWQLDGQPAPEPLSNGQDDNNYNCDGSPQGTSGSPGCNPGGQPTQETGFYVWATGQNSNSNTPVVVFGTSGPTLGSGWSANSMSFSNQNIPGSVLSGIQTLSSISCPTYLSWYNNNSSNPKVSNFDCWAVGTSPASASGTTQGVIISTNDFSATQTGPQKMGNGSGCVGCEPPQGGPPHSGPYGTVLWSSQTVPTGTFVQGSGYGSGSGNSTINVTSLVSVTCHRMWWSMSEDNNLQGFNNLSTGLFYGSQASSWGCWSAGTTDSGSPATIWTDGGGGDTDNDGGKFGSETSSSGTDPDAASDTYNSTTNATSNASDFLTSDDSLLPMSLSGGGTANPDPDPNNTWWHTCGNWLDGWLAYECPGSGQPGSGQPDTGSPGDATGNGGDNDGDGSPDHDNDGMPWQFGQMILGNNISLSSMSCPNFFKEISSNIKILGNAIAQYGVGNVFQCWSSGTQNGTGLIATSAGGNNWQAQPVIVPGSPGAVQGPMYGGANDSFIGGRACGTTCWNGSLLSTNGDALVGTFQPLGSGGATDYYGGFQRPNGTGTVATPITIAAQNNIVITSPLVKNGNPSPTNLNNAIGLVANNFVYINHPVTGENTNDTFNGINDDSASYNPSYGYGFKLCETFNFIITWGFGLCATAIANEQWSLEVCIIACFTFNTPNYFDMLQDSAIPETNLPSPQTSATFTIDAAIYSANHGLELQKFSSGGFTWFNGVTMPLCLFGFCTPNFGKTLFNGAQFEGGQLGNLVINGGVAQDFHEPVAAQNSLYVCAALTLGPLFGFGPWTVKGCPSLTISGVTSFPSGFTTDSYWYDPNLLLQPPPDYPVPYTSNSISGYTEGNIVQTSPAAVSLP